VTARRGPAAYLRLRVGSRHEVAFVPFPARAPMFVIGAAGTVVSFTLPEQIEAGHVDFARQLAAKAWAYAVAVERRYRGPSVFRQPTRPGTPGNPSRLPTPTSWSMRGGCCTPSPTVPDGELHSTRLATEPPWETVLIFRQPGRRHEDSA
jgi:hypothetical protein